MVPWVPRPGTQGRHLVRYAHWGNQRRQRENLQNVQRKSTLQVEVCLRLPGCCRSFDCCMFTCLANRPQCLPHARAHWALKPRPCPQDLPVWKGSQDVRVDEWEGHTVAKGPCSPEPDGRGCLVAGGPVSEGLQTTGTRDPDGDTSCGVSGQPAKVPGKRELYGQCWALETIHLASGALGGREDGITTMQAKEETRAVTVRSKGGKDKRNITEQSVAVRARGGEGSELMPGR